MMNKFDEIKIQEIYQKAHVDKFFDGRRVILKEIIRELYLSENEIISKLELDHIDRAFSKYRYARDINNISNPKEYFKACILSAIKESCLYFENDESFS